MSWAVRRRRGIALLFSLVLAMIFGIIAMAVLEQANHQTREMHRHDMRQRELAAAELALNKIYAELRYFLEFGTGSLANAVSSISAPTMENIVYEGWEITELGSQNEVQTSGPFIGLTFYTTHYKVELTARYTGPEADLITRPGVSVRQDIKVRYVPLYIYGIFYDADLEILPGPAFVQNGRVHSNGNIYVGAGNTTTFNNYFTSHGEIHHSLHPDDTNHSGIQGGTVRYTDGSSAISDVTATGYLDHDHSSWAPDSLTRWNGHVLDSAHGMPELPLPIPDAEDPHVVIEPAEADDPLSVQGLKFENLADLIIEVDSSGWPYTVSAHDAGGNPVDLTYDHDGNPGTSEIPVYTLSTFRDNREGHDVTTVDIDMQRLEASGIDPSNGIMYVNADTGVRLVNGSTLPTNVAGGFTVATNGPVYVEGDYNTVNTQLSLIAADAYNQLSNSWDDAMSYNSNLSYRTATNTTVKTVIMAGNVPTDADTPYSGGVENYFRFHERWSGVPFNFAGSIINLWDSDVATANWQYGSPIYEAPIRNWDWDIIYGGLAGPPGMPRAYFIDRLEWQLVDPTN